MNDCDSLIFKANLTQSVAYGFSVFALLRGDAMWAALFGGIGVVSTILVYTIWRKGKSE